MAMAFRKKKKLLDIVRYAKVLYISDCTPKMLYISDYIYFSTRGYTMVVTKEMQRKEERGLAAALHVLNRSKEWTEATIDAAQQVFAVSNGDNTSNLVRIGHLKEQDFPVQHSESITVAKLNVAKNEKTHPDTLDYMARQILFQNEYPRDSHLRILMLSDIIENKNVHLVTLKIIAVKDAGIAGGLAKNKIKERNKADAFLTNSVQSLMRS